MKNGFLNDFMHVISENGWKVWKRISWQFNQARDKINRVIGIFTSLTCSEWFGFRLRLIFATNPADAKSTGELKSG